MLATKLRTLDLPAATEDEVDETTIRDERLELLSPAAIPRGFQSTAHDQGDIDPKFRTDHRLAIIDGAGFAVVDRTPGLIECGEITDLEANTAGLPSFDSLAGPASDD